MSNLTQNQIEALNFFADAYLNTGCSDDDACAQAEFMLAKCQGDAASLYAEAERYRDM